MNLRLPIFLLALAALPAAAQVSLSTAVDLALGTNPRVKAAQDDAEKARNGVDQAVSVYVPSINAGASLGDSFGYSNNLPSLFTVTAQSLVYNVAQFDYIRAARASFSAANLTLQDARDSVAEDVALTYLAVLHDQQREAVLTQQTEYSARLVSIVEDRLAAGLDTRMELVSARLTAANLRLAAVHQQSQTVSDRGHLARLIGQPAAGLRVTGDMPPAPTFSPSTLPDGVISPLVAAAYANAHAKQEIAFGDNRFLFRPQVSLFAQYNRYATFASSFKDIQSLYSANNAGKTIAPDEEAFGVQITVPLFDKTRRIQARTSAAEAARAFHEAQNAEFLLFDGRERLRNSLAELDVHTEIASLQQQYAQLQLDALTAQLNSATGAGPQATPKEEQNSRINEREKYLALIDSTFTLRQTQITLLRQTGQLNQWLRTSAPSPNP